MNWKCLLALLPVVLTACSGPSTSGIGTSGSSDPTVSPATESKLQAFTSTYLKSLAAKDWNALAEIHWSGGKFSAQELQRDIEPVVRPLEGKVAEVELDRFLEYDKDSYSPHVDLEEIPGDIEALRGETEFFLLSDDPNDLDIYVWVMLCEEDGRFKVLKYFDLSRE